MVIRGATLRDCEGIMEVLNTCILEKNSFSALVNPVKSLEEEKGFFHSLKERERILIAQEGEIVGFTCIYLYSAIETMAHVGGVATFVLPSVRRKGIGTLLNETLVVLAKTLGYEKLMAEVRKKNEIGLRFYENCGFSPVAELKNQIKVGDTYDDIVLMGRWLIDF
ncbi:MAG: GNAT family N-acetyltransferase [Theionarchaea archaeon]|nr:GNAT family N-acetyltransferase [Theionarchaea archaeon]